MNVRLFNEQFNEQYNKYSYIPYNKTSLDHTTEYEQKWKEWWEISSTGRCKKIAKNLFDCGREPDGCLVYNVLMQDLLRICKDQ